MRIDRPVDLARLKKTVAVRISLFMIVMGLMFFWPAGTFRYWQAWAYIALLFIPMLFVMAFLLKKDPELLERRMRTREKEPAQKAIVKLSFLIFAGAFLLPGFDRRFGWSAVPFVVIAIADIVILAGYGLFALVMKENRYASRIVQVEEKQEVITTGPYAVVRHPMYLAALIIWVFSPLALGSYWAVLPALLLIFILVARIRNEEKVLAEELKGYREYALRVKYRLVPGIW